VPDRERKHATKMLGTVGSVLIVGVYDRFCVAVGIKSVTEFLQALTQLEVVVDLAVENDPCSPVAIVNRLLATLNIDNRKATHPQSHWPVKVIPLVIRASMANRIAHLRH